MNQSSDGRGDDKSRPLSNATARGSGCGCGPVTAPQHGASAASPEWACVGTFEGPFSNFQFPALMIRESAFKRYCPCKWRAHRYLRVLEVLPFEIPLRDTPSRRPFEIPLRDTPPRVMHPHLEGREESGSPSILVLHLLARWLVTWPPRKTPRAVISSDP